MKNIENLLKIDRVVMFPKMLDRYHPHPEDKVMRNTVNLKDNNTLYKLNLLTWPDLILRLSLNSRLVHRTLALQHSQVVYKAIWNLHRIQEARFKLQLWLNQQ